MNHQSKYLSKTLSTFSLGVILLVNAPFAIAQEVSVNQPAHVQSTQVVKPQIVNLNKSTFEQLVTLKGVGDTKAQAIIAYRQQVGSFKSINELSKVSGISEKIVSANKTRLSI